MFVHTTYAIQIEGLASDDLNNNAVPDDIEDVVENNDWYTTVDMGNGEVLEWADVTLTANISYDDVLDSPNINGGDTWRNTGWRFATRAEVWSLFQIFGATQTGIYQTYNGTRFSLKHVGTDISLLFGDLDQDSSQFSPEELDMVEGYVESTGWSGANAATVRDLGVSVYYDQTYVSLDRIPGYLTDSAHPSRGSWLVKGGLNFAPVFNLTNQVTNEGQVFTLDTSTTDPDGDILTYTALNLPSGSTYSSTTGEFVWTPSYTDAGIYNVTFIATDNGDPSLSASTTISIEVLDVNRAPTLTPIGTQTVSEGQNLTFTVSATDPDSDNLTYSATNTPAGSTFDTVTGLFSWTPGYNDEGNYTSIEFTVVDDGTPMELDVELITITVGNVNRAPVLSNPGPQSVLETELLEFSISAVDPDGDIVTLDASSTPAGSAFNPVTGLFSWTPTLADAGNYVATFTATDDGVPSESSVVSVTITVGDNPTPTEQAEDLVENVIAIEVPTNVLNSYLANLQKVEKFIEEGKIQATLNQLGAFINKIEQDYSQGLLTQEEYGNLLAAANGLIEDLTN